MSPPPARRSPRKNGPTVLVGGGVIGEVGDDPKVKALLHVGAFALDKGQSVGALIDGVTPTEGLKVLVDPMCEITHSFSGARS